MLIEKPLLLLEAEVAETAVSRLLSLCASGNREKASVSRGEIFSVSKLEIVFREEQSFPNRPAAANNRKRCR